MNEEEKKAIEFIKDLIAWDVRQDLCPNKKECENLEIILNLIERLQEQNKKYKEFFNAMFLKCEDKATDRLVDEILKLESE